MKNNAVLTLGVPMKNSFTLPACWTLVTAVITVLASCTLLAADSPKAEVMNWDGMPMRAGCDKNTITINECAHNVWKKADTELNKVYQEQLLYLRRTDSEFPPGRGSSVRLADAQRAWIAFRDKDCNYQVGEGGGSGDTFERLKCMYKRTLTRTAELREYIGCRANGCPF
jgi:uncharacterized protein YecT (DUF1311 family)